MGNTLGLKYLYLSALLCLGLLAGCKEKSGEGPAGGAPAGAAPAKANDEETIRGRWKVVRVEKDGKAMPEAEVARKPMTWTFEAGGKFIDQSRARLREGTYKLNPTKTPKELDLRIAEPGEPESVSPGLYELNGADLTVYVPNLRTSTTRPAAAKSAEDITVLGFKREPAGVGK